MLCLNFIFICFGIFINVISTSHISRITTNDINNWYWIHQHEYLKMNQIKIYKIELKLLIHQWLGKIFNITKKHSIESLVPSLKLRIQSKYLFTWKYYNNVGWNTNLRELPDLNHWITLYSSTRLRHTWAFYRGISHPYHITYWITNSLYTTFLH